MEPSSQEASPRSDEDEYEGDCHHYLTICPFTRDSKGIHDFCCSKCALNMDAKCAFRVIAEHMEVLTMQAKPSVVTKKEYTKAMKKAGYIDTAWEAKSLFEDMRALGFAVVRREEKEGDKQ